VESYATALMAVKSVRRSSSDDEVDGKVAALKVSVRNPYHSIPTENPEKIALLLLNLLR
jgi:hypothetical protein